MKIIFLFLFLVLLSVPALAWDDRYEVKPKFYDSRAGDGIMDAGSSLNPWVVRDDKGKEVYQIKPRYWTADPKKAGGSQNPYQVIPVH